MKENFRTCNFEEIKKKLQEVDSTIILNQCQKNRLDEVYKKRAEQLANRKIGDVHGTADIPVLVFFLGREKYALELNLLSRILPYKNCTPVPKVPGVICGIINFGGEIRCVVDLARLIGLNHNENNNENNKNSEGEYILILKKNEIGLKVHAISQLLLIKKKHQEQILQEKPKSSARYSRVIIQKNIILLNVDEILSHPVFKTCEASW
jgi:chemotaxis signal transduction protein